MQAYIPVLDSLDGLQYSAWRRLYKTLMVCEIREFVRVNEGSL
jgi:hypothetical protein